MRTALKVVVEQSREINVAEEMSKFINALSALLPSRNYFSQFLMMIPRDWPTMYDIYPEFLHPSMREKIRVIFGLEYGVNLNYRVDGLGWYFKGFLEKLFIFLDKPDIRKRISDLMGISDEQLINPRKEWFEARLKGVLNGPNGDKVGKILGTLINTKEPYLYWRSKRDLASIHKLEIEELDNILRYALIFEIIRSVVKEGKPGYMLSEESQKFIEIMNEMLSK